MLPNKYIPVDGISGENCYFDTGILPTNTMNIIALFSTRASPNAYCFGARNSSSSSSAGQLNFLAVDGTSYIGFASARLTLNENPISGLVSFLKDGREFTVLTNNSIFNKTGASTTFRGNRTMYLLAMNNAGNPSYGSSNHVILYGFKTEDGGEKHEFVPAYNTETAEFGIYDIVADNFITKSGTGTLDSKSLLTVETDGHGSAETINKVLSGVTKQYASTGYSVSVKATPNRNYSFLNWTINGEVVSTDEETSFVLSEDTTIVAHFQKNAQIEPSNRYQVLGLQYGVGSIQSSSAPNGRDSDIYTRARKFSIKVDGLAKATSTIECESVPSLYQVDMPIFLFSPRGKLIYCGIIKSIKDNVLTCREPMAILDHDFLFIPTTSVDGDNLTNRNILYASWLYLDDVRRGRCTSAGDSQVTSIYADTGLIRNMNAFHLSYDRDILYDSEKNTYVSTPLTTEYSLSNLEDYYFDLFEQFAIYVKPSLFEQKPSSSLSEKGVKKLMQLQTTNTKKYDTLVISDNIEAISDVSVDLSDVSATMLQIYNSTGKKFRGVYGMTKDGLIIECPDTSTIANKFIAHDTYKLKIVQSDDKINTIVEQNLSGALYNHKIRFTVDLGYDIYRLDDFQIGRKVDFYYKDKLYKSDVTAIEFSLDSDMNKIVSAKITLGNVRNKLTTKLNIGKSKKK